MKRLFLFAALLVQLGAAAQYTYDKLSVNLLEKEADQKNYTFENLRLYPVYARPAFRSHFKNVGTYTSLPQAIQKKQVRITEKDESGTVNSLTIENLGRDTIIVICGDVVKGGKQDRIIETDMVLAPRSGKKNIKVYCVESGRWQTERSVATTRQHTSNATRTAAMQAPKFEAHYNKGSMSLRKVVEKEKDQNKVWDKVAEINSKNVTVTETKTYTALSNNKTYNNRLQQYVRFFTQRFAADGDVIGVVVVTGNKVLGCDMFATPALFAAQFPSLLHSYATEALVNGSAVTATPTVVKAYLDPLLKNEASQGAVLKQKGTAFTDKGRKLRVSSFD